ncbi:MAG: O-antigen ligase family protein [Chloroflexota bacterium]
MIARSYTNRNSTQGTLALQIAVAVISSVLVIAMPLSIFISGIAFILVALLTLLNPAGALVAMLVLAPMRVLVATEAPPGTPSDLGQAFLLVFLLAWGFHRIGNRQQINFRAVSSPVFQFVGVYVLVLGLSGIQALSVMTWAREWLKWIQILVLIVVVVDLGAGLRWRSLVLGLAIAAGANAIIGIYQYFGGSGALHLLINGRFFRAFGTFGQPNPFGAFMGLTAPLVGMSTIAYAQRFLHRWWTERSLSWYAGIMAVFYGVTTLLLVTGLYMSFSRGAWLGFAASAGVMLVAFPRKLWQSALLAVGALAFAAFMWGAGLVPASIESRLRSITSEVFNVADVRGVDITPANYAIVERLAHWQAAIRMAEANPVLGVGGGNYEVAYAQYRLINWDEALGHAHNYYLNVLAETGILGILTYLTMWIGVVIIGWRARQHPDMIARYTVIGLLGTWTYLSVHSLTDNLYVNNLFLHVGVMLGLLAVIERQQREFAVLES